jgi:hypothetical protein
MFVAMVDHVRHVSDEAKASDSASAMVVRAHRGLLRGAREHMEAGRYQEAILIAQAGAEASSARAITALLAKYPVPLQEALLGAFGADSNYNLSHTRPRKVWTFLTGDVICDQKFWAEYKAHIERRNKAAHNTAPGLTKANAEVSLIAATAFVDHIELVTGGVLGSNGW